MEIIINIINNALFWIFLYFLAFIWFYLMYSNSKSINFLFPSSKSLIILSNFFISIMIFIIPILIAYCSQPRFYISSVISYPISMILFFIAIYIEISARKKLGFLPGGPFPGLRKKNELVTTGIYSKVRHPIYLGIILWQFGFALIFNALYALVFSTVYIFAILIIIKIEEQDILKKYGKEYEKYIKKVPSKLIPKII